MLRQKILVVDDNTDHLMVMKSSLEEEGFEVILAENAKEARDLLATELPDLVMTDIMMPGESGFSLITHIRDNELYKNTPIIAVSVLDAEHDVLTLGADAYIPKPFIIAEVLEVIEHMLQRADLPESLKKAVNYMKEKEYDRARFMFEKILEIGNKGAMPAYAAFYLGEISRVVLDYVNAEEYYKQALHFKPDMWPALTMLGQIAHVNKDVRRCVKYLEASLKINPDQPKIKEIKEKLEKDLFD